MKGGAAVAEIEFVEEICIECAIRYWVPKEFEAQRIDDHRIFHCPNGHKQHYRDKSKGMDREELFLENKELKKQVMQLRHALDQREAALSECRQELEEFTSARTDGLIEHKPRKPKPWQCSACGKAYKSEACARRHAKRDHAPRRHPLGRKVGHG